MAMLVPFLSLLLLPDFAVGCTKKDKEVGKKVGLGILDGAVEVFAFRELRSGKKRESKKSLRGERWGEEGGGVAQGCQVNEVKRQNATKEYHNRNHVLGEKVDSKFARSARY